MKLQFKNQAFQETATAAICDVFEGQPYHDPNVYTVDPGKVVASGQLSVASNEVSLPGFETLQQLDELETGIKNKLLQWVENLPVKYQYQEFFFCHAGVDPDVPLPAQTEFDMLWRRQQWWEQYRGEETIVVGHTPVQKVKKRARYAKPLFLPNNIIMCDTGAYMTGGKLTCVDVLSQEIWQV